MFAETAKFLASLRNEDLDSFNPEATTNNATELI